MSVQDVVGGFFKKNHPDTGCSWGGFQKRRPDTGCSWGGFQKNAQIRGVVGVVFKKAQRKRRAVRSTTKGSVHPNHRDARCL